MSPDTMSRVVVFCRRWVAWDEQPSQAGQSNPSNFHVDFQVQELHAQWQRSNPQIPLHSYRWRLQELALRSWQASGAQVIQHAMPADAPHQVPLPAELIVQLRAARWVIPMDDDDWLAPDLNCALPDPASRRTWLAVWPSQLIYLHTDHYKCTEPFAILPETQASACPTLVSCSYALSSHMIQRLNDEELELALMQHGEASRWRQQIPGGLRWESSICRAVHLRHQATAGSTRLGSLNRTLGNFAKHRSGRMTANWAVKLLEDLSAVHTQLIDKPIKH